MNTFRPLLTAGLLLSLTPYSHATFNATFTTVNEVTDGQFRYDNVGTVDATSVDMVLTFTRLGDNQGNSRTSNYVNGQTGFHANADSIASAGNSARVNVRGSQANFNPYIEFNIKFVDSSTLNADLGTASAVAIPNLLIQTFDLDSDLNEDYSDTFGVRDNLTPDTYFASNTRLQTVTSWEGTQPDTQFNYNLVQQDPAGVGVVTDWEDEYPVDRSLPANLAEQEQITVTYVFELFTTGDFVATFTGTDTNTNNRGFFLSMENPPFIPTVVPEPVMLPFMVALFGLAIWIGRRNRRA